MSRLTGVLQALGILASLSSGALAQDYVWIETQFYRVHLRNGNFIDGKHAVVTEREIQLDLSPGQMSIRRDSVDRVEIVKMRTIGEKPKLDPALKRSPKVASAAEVAPGRTAARPLLLPRVDQGTQERVEAILLRLRIATPDQKDELIPEIARLAPGAAPYLACKLGSVDEESCQRLSQALIKMRDPAALPYLSAALEDDRAYVRISALLVIGDTGNLDVVGPVRSRIGDPDDAVRASAIKALQRLGDTESLREIIECMEAPDSSVRTAAISAALELGRRNQRMSLVIDGMHAALDRASGQATLDLLAGFGRSGQHEQWTTLGRYVRDGDPKIRASSVGALAALAAPESEELLLGRLLQEDDKRAQIQLTAAIRALKAKRAIEPLIGWLRNEDPDVAASAELTLRELTRQNIGMNPARWAEWWEQARPR